MLRIAIDLTPILPGGENGGAKLMTIELIRHMSKSVIDMEFVLLTSHQCHEELAFLDADNVSRVCVVEIGKSGSVFSSLFINLKTYFLNCLKIWFNYKWQQMQPSFKSNNLLKEVGADLLFCPFTAPLFFEPTIPTVSVIYDLQYRYYPQFFGVDELYHRNKHFMDACRLADRLICISDYVRETVVENSDIDPRCVETAHIRLSSRLDKIPDERIKLVLSKFDLREESFIFYPANFWPHKNHTMLLTAFSIYKAQHPESNLKLVCTGAPDARMEYLQQAVNKMGLENCVVFLGYLSNEEFAGLMTVSRALIFPSLYEGFGMPILEAMAFGKPVLCSNVTSLPEVAGDAALFFDPKKPVEIAESISRIENEPELLSKLIEKGYSQLKSFGDPQEMAVQYLQIFKDAVNNRRKFSLALHGIYPDGWTSDRVIVTYESNPEKRRLEMQFFVPDYIPTSQVSINVLSSSSIVYKVPTGQLVKISQELPHEGGLIEFILDPVFQPKMYGMNEDTRALGCLCQLCQVVTPNSVIDLRSF